MKSPAELKVTLRRQWEVATRREARLLNAPNAWPVVVSIGRPSPRRLSSDLDSVKRHVDAWRKVKVGEVVWESVRYRAATSQVDVPTQWKLYKPTEWIAACGDPLMRQEFGTMATLVEQTAPLFHSHFIRRRSLWRDKPIGEVIQAARLAMALEPGCAAGSPLRLLSVEGIDTKFFERNARLVTVLLDARFDGEVSQIGLETFLGAFAESDHWLLVMDLDGTLLPFQKQRVRSSELQVTTLPGERLLIVENESCQHQLPTVPRTIAVLGAGLDLGWTKGRWLSTKEVAYWGDIDTWGLQSLSRAREEIGNLKALLMTVEVYDQFADSAVPEPVVAGIELPSHLDREEKVLYKRLLQQTRGRLEQEFLPAPFVEAAIRSWTST